MRDFLGLSERGQAMGLFFIGYPAIEWPKGYRKPIGQLTRWLTD